MDIHGARDQWMCMLVYDVDNSTEPAEDKTSMTITMIYLNRSRRSTKESISGGE